MFKNRLLDLAAGLVIVILALLSVSTVMSNVQVFPTGANSQWAPLDWYMAHDHAVPVEQDTGLVTDLSNATDAELAPLDWYFAHNHANLDGDNNIVSRD